MKDNMKVVNKKEETKTNKFIEFINKTDKLNKIAMILIVTAYLIVAAVLIGVIDTIPNYNVVPTYDEIIYNEEVNPVVKVYSNYSITDEELIKKDSVMIILYGESSNGTKNININTAALLENDKMIYFNDKETMTSTTIYSTQIQSSKVLSADIKKFFAEVSDKFTNKDEDLLEKKIEFSEKMIQLTKEDLNKDLINGITNAKYYIDTENGKQEKSIFTSFQCNATLQSDEKNYQITSSFEMSLDDAKKYHLDLQVFAVDGKDIYEIAGFYNVSTTVNKPQLQTIIFPKDQNIDFIYVKGKYFDENGVEVSLFYKEKFANIIK